MPSGTACAPYHSTPRLQGSLFDNKVVAVKREILAKVRAEVCWEEKMQELGLPLWGLIDNPFAEPGVSGPERNAGRFYLKHPELVDEKIAEINAAYPKVPPALNR